jgi:hypothetical protein
MINSITIDSNKRGIREHIQFTLQKGKDTMVLDLAEFANIYYFVQESNNAYDVARYIADAYRDLNKTSIWVDMSGEGFNYACLDSFDKVVKSLINHFGFVNTNIYYIAGALDIEENYNLYAQHCIRFHWMPLNLICNNTFESGTVISENALIATDQNLTPNLKNKIFTSLNRAPRSHRLYLIGEILRRRLEKKAYFSAYVNSGLAEHTLDPASLDYLQHQMPTLWKTTVESIGANYKRFPIRLNLAEGHSPDEYMKVNDNDIYYYTASYLHLITETKFFHDLPTSDAKSHHMEVCLDCYFITEKTYKAIVGRVPFILVGLTGSLSALRKRGYQTFHPYIDETYDTIENDEARLNAIMNEIDRLVKFSKEEWLAWQANIIPIVEHNFKLIRSRQDTESQI